MSIEFCKFGNYLVPKDDLTNDSAVSIRNQFFSEPSISVERCGYGRADTDCKFTNIVFTNQCGEELLLLHKVKVPSYVNFRPPRKTGFDEFVDWDKLPDEFRLFPRNNEFIWKVSIALFPIALKNGIVDLGIYADEDYEYKSYYGKALIVCPNGMLILLRGQSGTPGTSQKGYKSGHITGEVIYRP